MNMDQGYDHKLVNIENEVQDRNSVAWKKLCEYVEKIAEEGSDEFSPFEYLGKELYTQIYTLPESIAKLKSVKKIWLYGSKLKRIPPEIGEMDALEYFDPYTSYNLHWFPYEITNCKNLKDSRVSTRALYGNFKHRRPFPDLSNNPVRYEGDNLKCSVCNQETTYEQISQFWISLRVGTDVLPLLVNLCSEECKTQLPQPPDNYVSYPHKGGKDLIQPLDWDGFWELKRKNNELERIYLEPEIEDQEETGNAIKKTEIKIDLKDLPVLKLIRKIWER